jgi:hypothetical protein
MIFNCRIRLASREHSIEGGEMLRLSIVIMPFLTQPLWIFEGVHTLLSTSFSTVIQYEIDIIQPISGGKKFWVE